MINKNDQWQLLQIVIDDNDNDDDDDDDYNDIEYNVKC